MANGSTGALNGVQAFGTAFLDGLLDPGERAAIHESAAQAANRAVVNAYLGQTQQGFPNPYREGNRFSGGALLGALESGIIAQPNADGVDFLSPAAQSELNARARQWRRLQYGAGAGGRTPGGGDALPVRFKFANAVVATRTLSTARGPAFTIPSGAWIGPSRERVTDGSPAQFFARANFSWSRRYPTVGINPRRYLDTGLAILATTMSDGYTKLYNEAYKKGTDAFAESIRTLGGGPIPFSVPSFAPYER
jgi:hypothetical protein